MAFLFRNFVAAAVLAVAAIAVSAPSQAGPAMSAWSDEADYDQDSCVQRARAAFVADGWQSLKPSGYLMLADRGPLSGVIICLDESLTQSIPVVVVSGGDGNAADDEAQRLKIQLLGR